MKQYLVYPEDGDYHSPLLQAAGSQVCYIGAHELVRSGTKIEQTDQLYVSSDTVYPIIRPQLGKTLQSAFRQFRDKYRFRESVAALCDSFHFQKLTLDEITHLRLQKGKQYILKPVSGFMGGATCLVDSNTNLVDLKAQVAAALQRFRCVYPTIFSENMLLETYIAGDKEYAVDMYYDATGHPVILNIYLHPPAHNKQYVQLLYCQSQHIYADNLREVTDFFTALNREKALKNLPIHAEFKRCPHTHRLIPIECNPGRFGGMGLVDLSVYGFGISLIQAYFRNQAIDWEELGEDKPQILCWMAAYNDPKNPKCAFVPNHQAFKAFMQAEFQLLQYTTLDHKKYPLFAIVYFTTCHFQKLQKLLSLNFKAFDQGNGPTCEQT